jgi:hypothetical protein
MELQQRWGAEWDQDAAQAFQRDLEDYLTMAIGPNHAPIMVPRTIIDAGSSEFTIVIAAITNCKFSSTATATTTSFTDLLNYTGRGVLTRFIAGEFDSGGAAGLNAGIKITVDDEVIYLDNPNFITTQMKMKCVVGSVNYESTSVVNVHPCPVGIPFNKSIRIQGLISAGTLSAGWNLCKKL